MREIVYLVRKGNKYLQAVTGEEGETDVTKMRLTFSIYRYDAVQLPGVAIAKQTIQALRKDGDESWGISRYNKVTYFEEVLF